MGYQSRVIQLLMRGLASVVVGLFAGLATWRFASAISDPYRLILSIGVGLYLGLVTCFIPPSRIFRSFSGFEFESSETESDRQATSKVEQSALEEIRDEIRSLVDSTSAITATRVETAAESALAASGRIAEVELSRGYDGIARRAESQSNRLQVLAATALVIAFGLAFWLVHGLHDQHPSIGEVLARLSISLPGSALFAYLSNEASVQRRLAVWATQVGVQLKSISAYVDRLEPSARNDILKELGLKVFVGSALTTESRGGRRASAEGALEYAVKLVQILRATEPPAR